MRSRPSAAIAKIITRMAMSRMYAWAPSRPASATRARPRKITRETSSAAAALRNEPAISTAPHRKKPGGPQVEHERHQEINEHRGDRLTAGAGRRRRPHEARDA